MEDVVISARGLVRRYGSLEVLRGIDLDIPAGQITAIVGPSGAGKTTLLHLLGTLDRPDAGTLTVHGTRVDSLPPRDLAAFRNAHIGFIFQFHRLLAEFSALENVLLPAWVAGRDDRTTRDRAERLLRDLGLGDRLTHRPAALSGGEQQRVAAARALMNAPAVILADEPTGNLDTDNAEALFDLFRELRDREGATFAVVTHNDALAATADRIVRMRDGRIEGGGGGGGGERG
jgi:lipoprotein-releasing system ATP-binding protein